MTHEVIYDYVEGIDPNLTCAICQSALVDPVTTTSCKHTFCRDCINQAITINPQCPIDRSALTITSLRDTEQLVKLMLDELKVKCVAEECGMVMERGLLLSHLRSCPKAIVTCQDGDCGLSMSRHRLPHHRAYECFQRRMECDRCKTILIFKDKTAKTSTDCCVEISPACRACGELPEKDKQHHRWTCPAIRVACPHSNRGCPAIIARNELQDHLSNCPFEALSGFFEQNDARLRLLEQKNETLQAELELMKAEMTNMRVSDTSRLSRSYEGASGLGSASWSDPIRQPGINMPSPAQVPSSTTSPSTPLTNAEHSQTPAITNQSQDTTPRLAIPTLQPSIPISNTSSPISPLSSSSTRYTDALYSGITARAAADLSHQRSLVALSFASHQSYADWAFNRLSSHNMLNVEDAVQALRSSIIQLAGGMDTMERRNEVRTMTESLRVLEEVGSLRAIVNTMRMQVMMSQPSRPASLYPHPAAAPPHTSYNLNSWSTPGSSLPIYRTTHCTTTESTNNETHGAEIERPRLTNENGTGEDREHSIRESLAFSTVYHDGDDDDSGGEVASSRSSVITAHNASRTRQGIGRTIGSGAGLTGRTMAIPPPTMNLEGNGDSSNEAGIGNGRSSRLSRANPINLIRKQPSRSHNRPRL
ncbi:uncharacterized protein L201_006541 [Kwoniella dendrophila CBS 6074]|uniref:E3 ubiquitin-protein ligase NRDP1 n=1 Tax=Kwoniella dendrophila CBS 6074 TaxID=1295534 RepID=A0AAX4K4A2_9TREE